MTTYNASYEVGDVDDVIIDITVESMIQVLNFIGLIVLMVLLVWMMKHIKKIVPK